jgi:hypothetical protein
MTPDICDRIRLIHTNDRYTRLKRGSITDVTYLPEDYGGELKSGYVGLLVLFSH